MGFLETTVAILVGFAIGFVTPSDARAALKYLSSYGNLFVLTDEFRGIHMVSQESDRGSGTSRPAIPVSAAVVIEDARAITEP